jgi:hypothetical protein
LLLALALPFILPPGLIEISSEIRLPDGTHDLVVKGSGSTILHAADSFEGRAIFSCKNCRNIIFENFAIDGNRAALEQRVPPPSGNRAFARYFRNNGLLIEESDGVTFRNLQFRNIASFPILVKTSRNVVIEDSSVIDSGSRNPEGLNNTTGGFVLEEGTGSFRIVRCRFENIRGNAVWTHAYYWAERNYDGEIAGNTFAEIGRDAIQVGRSTRVRVHHNYARRVGYPVEIIDADPVGIDTAGNVDDCVYENNSFAEVDGKCIDLDGFHDGVVRANSCINRGKPEDYPRGNFGIALNNTPILRSENIFITDNRLDGMKYGGIFVIGSGHQITGNQMIHLNQHGIYLAAGAGRPDPARHLRIENNVIAGPMCIEAADGVKLTDSVIQNNMCRDE